MIEITIGLIGVLVHLSAVAYVLRCEYQERKSNPK